jgi:hypothetical protein
MMMAETREVLKEDEAGTEVKAPKPEKVKSDTKKAEKEKKD